MVLRKKPSRKLHMCVDYTDMNEDCPKNAYNMLNIEKLVDNSAK